MFDAKVNDKGELVLSGRFDASQVEKARPIFDNLQKSCVVNFNELDYISSAGLSVLLATQKRLNESGEGLKLCGLNKYIRDVFRYAGFDTVFEID